MGRIVVILLCAALLGAACGRDPPADTSRPKKTLHLPLATPNRVGPRHVYARGDTLWSMRRDGSGRLLLAYFDSTGVFVVVCNYLVVRDSDRWLKVEDRP